MKPYKSVCFVKHWGLLGYRIALWEEFAQGADLVRLQ